MRIGLIIYGSLDTLSGGYLYDRKLVDYLRSCGDEVEVVSLPWRSYPRHLLDNFAPAWRRRLAGLRVDVLLQDELNHPSLAWSNRPLQDAPFPVVSLVHHLRSSEEHPAWLLPLYRWVEGSYLATVERFIFNSHTTERSVASLLHSKGAAPGAPLPDSLIAYPAADHLKPPPAPEVQRLIDARCAADGPIELLFVGNPILRKGLHHLLPALAQLPTQQWLLHVIGRGDVDSRYTAAVRTQISRLGLTERVTLYGRVSDTDLQKFLRRSHLLTVPSYEGFGIVYLEAMAFGLPVLGSTAGAAQEIVQPGVNGFLVEPAATAEMARTLAAGMENRTGLAEMGAAARRVYESHPTWAETGAAIRRFLGET